MQPAGSPASSIKPYLYPAAKNLPVAKGEESTSHVTLDEKVSYRSSWTFVGEVVFATYPKDLVQILKLEGKRTKLFKNLYRPTDDADHEKWAKVIATNSIVAVFTNHRNNILINYDSVNGERKNTTTTNIQCGPSNA